VTAAPEITAPLLRRAPEVLSRRSGDSVLLLVRHQDRGLLEISGAGVELWNLLDEARSAEECAHRLATSYAVDLAKVRHDIAPVLDALVEAGALEVLDGAR
jgi:hypothetical protein